MTCSLARLEANRRNSQLSSGPRSVEGKNQSRKNALKHGLTGAGVAVPIEDAARVAERFQGFAEDLKPRGELAEVLVQRAALHSVRMERSMVHESAMIAQAMRQTESQHDIERAAAVSALIARLKTEPDVVAPQLRATPQGIDWMIQEWEDIREVMGRKPSVHSKVALAQRADNLTGRRLDRLTWSSFLLLLNAADGYFQDLPDTDGAGLDPDAREAWAEETIQAKIAAEIAALQTLRVEVAEIDDADRAEAATRALFNASPQATLARRYEAAAERGMFRALRELREHQAAVNSEARTSPVGKPVEPASLPKVEPQPKAPTLGSFGAERPVRQPERSTFPTGEIMDLVVGRPEGNGGRIRVPVPA